MGYLTLLRKIAYALLAIISRLSGFLSGHTRLHSARFAALHELAGLMETALTHEASLILGTSRLRNPLAVRPTKQRRELGNLLVVAPNRGGKGLLATSQLLTWKHSAIVNDIKGELFSQTAGYRSELGNVFVIDPTGVGNRYDPLQGKFTEDELLSAATHLLFHPDEGEGAIFSQRATNMLTQVFLASRIEGQAPFPYARRVLRSGLPQAAARLEAINPELATQFLDVTFDETNFTDRFLLSAWGTLTARTKPLLTETVVRSLAHSDFTRKSLCFQKSL